MLYEVEIEGIFKIKKTVEASSPKYALERGLELADKQLPNSEGFIIQGISFSEGLSDRPYVPSVK